MQKKANEMKKLIFPLVSFFILAPTIIVLLCILAAGKVTLGFQGLAADKDGNLYLGKNSEIEVYDINGNHTRSIDYPLDTTLCRHSITIIGGDKIIADIEGRYYFTDLYGKVLAESENPIFLYLMPKTFQTRFAAADGAEYRLFNAINGAKIIRFKDGKATLVYKAPAMDTIIPVVLALCLFWFLAAALYFLINAKKLLGFKEHEDPFHACDRHYF